MIPLGVDDAELPEPRPDLWPPGEGLRLLAVGRLSHYKGFDVLIDALTRAYDHVVLDAGTAVDLPTTLIAQNAHAVIIPDPAVTPAARATMRDQLIEAGFGDVTILNGAAQDPEIGAAGDRIAAA